MVNLPLALIGGVAGVYLAGGVLSVASIVGFITLFGIATRNGIMLVSHIRHLQTEEGVTDFRTAVVRGATERVVPILMTALAAGLALVPIALSAGRAGQRDPGADGDGHHVRAAQLDGAEHDRRADSLRSVRQASLRCLRAGATSPHGVEPDGVAPMSGDHPHGASNTSVSRLGWTLALVVLYAGVEVAGGVLSGSLALLADAGHMVSDAGAIGLTLFAMQFARRPPSPAWTFGYYRAEILAALVNGATLVGIALFILVEAVERLRTPAAVEGPLMLAVAGGGLLVNVAGLYLLRGGQGASLNIRGAWLHVLTDALGSAQAIAAAILIWMFGWNWVDPVASILIALLVVYSSWSLLRQSVAVLMEGAPGHIDVDAVRDALGAVHGVDDVHDLHVWTITSGFVALSAHLVVGASADAADVLSRSERCLVDRFAIRHSTLQLDVGTRCGQARHDTH